MSAPSLDGALHAVILAYGPSRRAAELADRVAAEGVAPSRIHVVHNPSRPGEPPPAVGQDVDVVRSPRNLGYAGGMNLGVDRALSGGARLLLVLTHDARFTPGAVGLLVDAAHRCPEYGVLGPELFDARRGVMFSYGVRVDATGGPHHRVQPPGEADRGVWGCDAVDGAFAMIRAEVFESVGRYDERFFMYYEEAELMLRARRAGWRVGVVQGARAEQDVGEGSRPGAYAYLRVRNGLHFAREAAGGRGLAGGAARALRDLAMYGRRALNPRSSPAGRAAARAAVQGAALGAVHFATGRLGPPPAGLPGSGDLRL